MEKTLPPIPVKRYFTIGEVGELCGVKPHVLRYWEQEFTQLRPMKRRGNRRYYQHHEVLMIRRIRDLLYDQGFTISGARNKLQELVQGERDRRKAGEVPLEGVEAIEIDQEEFDAAIVEDSSASAVVQTADLAQLLHLRRELFEIRELLTVGRLISKAIIESFGLWRSLVAHLHGVQGVEGSNPFTPTKVSRWNNGLRSKGVSRFSLGRGACRAFGFRIKKKLTRG